MLQYSLFVILCLFSVLFEKGSSILLDSLFAKCHDHSCQEGQKAIFNGLHLKCECVCTENRGCRYQNCPHPYCTNFFGLASCHCGDCTTDSHCKCGSGQTAQCMIDYKHHPTHYCQCQTHSTTPTTTSTSTTTTTTLPLVKLECSHHKIQVIESIAENLHVEDDRAAVCPGIHKYQSSEAFVIQKCNCTDRSKWTKGSPVNVECKNHQITPYTPISTFPSSGDPVAGFLVECNEHGFKMAFQTCTDTPKVTVVTTSSTPSQSEFYTIFSPIHA